MSTKHTVYHFYRKAYMQSVFLARSWQEMLGRVLPNMCCCVVGWVYHFYRKAYMQGVFLVRSWQEMLRRVLPNMCCEVEWVYHFYRKAYMQSVFLARSVQEMLSRILPNMCCVQYIGWDYHCYRKDCLMKTEAITLRTTKTLSLGRHRFVCTACR
jgi:hypothetical protein